MTPQEGGEARLEADVTPTTLGLQPYPSRGLLARRARELRAHADDTAVEVHLGPRNPERFLNAKAREAERCDDRLVRDRSAPNEARQLFAIEYTSFVQVAPLGQFVRIQSTNRVLIDVSATYGTPLPSRGETRKRRVALGLFKGYRVERTSTGWAI